MTDLERIARAIWADRAARILAEDIAGKTEEGSAGKLTYDELGDKFQAGLMSEARAAVAEVKLIWNEALAPALADVCNEQPHPRASFKGTIDAILNSENAT